MSSGSRRILRQRWRWQSQGSGMVSGSGREARSPCVVVSRQEHSDRCVFDNRIPRQDQVGSPKFFNDQNMRRWRFASICLFHGEVTILYHNFEVHWAQVFF